jgi:phage anti-repressor protein
VPDLYNKIFVIIDLYYTKETKEILTKDMTDEELENILYNNIYQLEKIKKDFDSINDLNIKKQLEQYFRDRIKIYINKYDINNYIKNLRKVLEQKKEFSELINENIKILSVIELQYSIMVMDFYLLSRLLKKYRYDSTKKINQDYTKNIIIAAGHFHIVEYVKFFKDYLNYNLIYEENKLVDLLIKDAPDIKDYIKLDIPVSWKRQERYRKKQNEYNTAIKQYVEEHENLLNKKCVKI